jgi:hypothetical protein
VTVADLYRAERERLLAAGVHVGKEGYYSAPSLAELVERAGRVLEPGFTVQGPDGRQHVVVALLARTAVVGRVGERELLRFDRCHVPDGAEIIWCDVRGQPALAAAERGRASAASRRGAAAALRARAERMEEALVSNASEALLT